MICNACEQQMSELVFQMYCEQEIFLISYSVKKKANAKGKCTIL